MPETAAAFTDLERAFWRHVDQNCPHPMSSRHRYSWLRANRIFNHGGVSWERSTRNAEQNAFLIVFTAADGAVVQHKQATAPIYSSA